jgi:hypothetical protein
MGTTVTLGQKTAALYNMCQSATQQAEEYCNQPLRATLATEQQTGPDYYLTVQTGSGMGRMLLQRWPVTQITAVQVAPATFPLQWAAVPAGYWQPERPIQPAYGTNAPPASGQGGQAILIAPGYVNWANGRNGFFCQATYMSGWPHTSLTATGSASSTAVSVDDCTGWAPAGTASAASTTNGCVGVIYDGSSQETVTCTAASAASGPGTLTLSSGLSYTHSAGVMVSALPANVIWGSALFAAADALTRGATSTTVRSMPGHAAGPQGADELRIEAELKLRPYKVTV